MSTASKPATVAFAHITGASSGIGAIYADRPAKRRSVAPLFRPFVLSKLSLANRVVMAPMTRQKSPGGSLRQLTRSQAVLWIELLRRRRALDCPLSGSDAQ